MKKRALHCLLLPVALCLLSCASVSQRDFTEAIRQEPAKRLESYAFDPKSSLVSRIGIAPDFLLKYLSTTDKKDGYTPYMPDSREMAMIDEYLAKLPSLHKRVLRERLLAVYFVNNFWGSGMADFVLGEHAELYTILIINPQTMKHDLTAWMTYRENTIFKDDDAFSKIIVNCGTEYTGLMYALLHETTHIVDYVRKFTPYTDREMGILNKTSGKTAFVKDVWADFRTPEAANDDKKRKNITVYGFDNGPLLSRKDAVSLYERLSRTPFPSLYGWTAWPEDFAEYVTWRHLTANLKQPYTIAVYDHDKLVFTLAPFNSGPVLRRMTSLQDIFMQSDTTGKYEQ